MFSRRIFFLLESIGDLSNLGTECEPSNDIKYGMQKLEWEFKRILECVRDIEAREDTQFEERFSLELSSIVDNAEDIIAGLTIGKDSADSIDVIRTLIQRIENFYIALSSAPTYNFITGNNYNLGHQQTTGSISVYIGPNTPPLIKRVEARRKSYGHVQNSDLVGFRQETETLLEQLIQNDHTRVVGIVGMGGSGKTTLAKHLFHHSDIKNHFAHKAWICVSQSWNKRDLLYEILRQTQGAMVGREMVKSWSDEELVENLYEYLGTKLYLVMLDDIWAVDAWDEISAALPPCTGSKILVTTRNEAVPELLDCAFFVLEPKPLNTDDSFELFCKRAFTGGRPQPKFVNLGKDMVRKCKGLPLAITALAGALRGKKLLSDWMAVSRTLTQRIMNTQDSTTQGVVNEILALSYHDLPCYLKPCFLYLSILPEDRRIHARTLLRLWIAECLVTEDPLYEEETMPRAEEYLDELIQRYIVQDVKRNYMGRVKEFQIHDLIRDMCDKKAKERGFLQESRQVALCLKSLSQLQTEQQCRDRLSSLFHPVNSSRCRSLTIFDNGVSKLSVNDHEGLMLRSLQSDLNKFRFLRILIFKLVGARRLSLPEAIGSLIHLRYLRLGGTEVHLPESIGNLQNLLTLELPTYPEVNVNFWKLKRLKRLYFYYLPKRPAEVRLRLDMLANVQTLWNLVGGSWMLGEMHRLSPTLRKLGILQITNQSQLDAVFQCPSIKLDNLETLKLDWYTSAFLKSRNYCWYVRFPELENMEALKHCTKLRKLHLTGIIQDIKGVPLVFPPNLEKLEVNCARLKVTDLMEILGTSLPYLKVLCLGSFTYLGTELTCKADSFPELEQLELDTLENLELWNVECGAMPSLKHLDILNCKKLYRFPEAWRFVSQLEQVTTERMSVQFNESLKMAREHHADLILKISCQI